MNVTEVWRRLESDPRVEDAEHWVAVYAELERSLLRLSAALEAERAESVGGVRGQLAEVGRRLAYWRRVRDDAHARRPGSALHRGA